MGNDGTADKVHVWPLRVYYEDTDAAGIVYYANYLKFAERARTELLRALGISHDRLRTSHGLAFAVRDCSIDYRAPARLDEALEIHTRVLAQSGASIRAEQTVVRDGEPLVRITLRLACLRADGRPARLPALVRQAIDSYRDSAAPSRKLRA